MARVGEELKKSREEAKMTMKQLAKKLGVSESFINEVEQGRRVVNEDLMKRYSKVLNKNIKTMGLGSLEEMAESESVTRTKEVIKKETYIPPKTPVNELWNQAFGENIKNVPIFDLEMKKPIGHRSFVVENKKIDGYPQDKVMMFKVQNDDLKAYRIQKGDYLIAHEHKDIKSGSIMLVSYQDKKLLRMVKNLNNGTVELIHGQNQSQIVPIKEITVFAQMDKLEITLP